MSSTRIDEVNAGIYRISTAVPPTVAPGGFSFNQYLVVDDEPLLFHTGARSLFPAVREAIERVIPPGRLRYIAFSHHEQDECGGLAALLAAAPLAVPVCSRVNAMINGDGMDRPPRVLTDGESLTTGSRTFQWIDAPHFPHAWENGFLFDQSSATLFCGDLFTQPGTGEVPLTQSDILGPSEHMRRHMDYYAHGTYDAAHVERLAALQPRLLACMHGSAWTGDGAALLRALGVALGANKETEGNRSA